MEQNVAIFLSLAAHFTFTLQWTLPLSHSLSLPLSVCFCFDYLFISPIFSFYDEDKLRTQARGPTYLFLATHTVRLPPRLLYDASNSVIIRWTGGCQCAAATSKCCHTNTPTHYLRPFLRLSLSCSLIMTNSWKFPCRQFTMIKHQILPTLSLALSLSVSLSRCLCLCESEVNNDSRVLSRELQLKICTIYI